MTVLACLALGAAALAVELSLPPRLATGGLFCAVVLGTIWARDARVTIAFTLMASLLVVLELGLVDSGAVEPNPVVTRGGLAIGLVWISGAVVVSRLAARTRFRTALEAAPGGMLLVDRRGRVSFANATAGEIFGLNARQLRGKRASDLLAIPEDTFIGLASRNGVRSSPAPTRQTVVRGRRRGGRTFLAECDLRVVRREIDALVLVTIRDMTAERRFEVANERLAAIVRTSRDAILAKDLDGKIIEWNPGAEAMYGYTAEEAIGRHISFLVPPSRRTELDSIMASVRRDEDISLRTQRVTKSGRIIEVDLSVAPIHDHAGRVMGAGAFGRDRTQECDAERRLLELNTALRHAMPGTVEVGPQGLVRAVNHSGEELLGLPSDQLIGRPWEELVHEDERAELAELLPRMREQGSASAALRTAAETERIVELFVVPFPSGDERSLAFHVFLRDVTARSQAEANVRQLAEKLQAANRVLERQANVDPLTGILNRRGMERRLGRLRTTHSKKAVAAVLIDLDDFKAINEAFGHCAGDRVLGAVAERLEDAARVTDPVARIGGDEFLALLPEASLAVAGRVAERMREEVARLPVAVAGGEVGVTCSIGVAVLPADEATISGSLAAARAQLARSKGEGKDRVCLPEGVVQADMSASAAVVAGLGLRAVHQPIYDLVENRVTAFEMLVRGPRGERENPAALFSQVGSGQDQTLFDLRCLAVCAEAAASLPENATVHINLFPSTLIEAGAGAVLEQLRRAGPGRLICVELNERDIPTDSETLHEEVNALKRAGIQLGIDDVGFGRTTLEALLQLEPDIIKIDRAYVGQEREDRALERLIAVAHALRARVIAEGIEDDETLARLLEHRVRFGQGFLWGRPTSVPEDPTVVLWPQPRLGPQKKAHTDDTARNAKTA